ncbi:hypothetical protein U1Q18_047437, partial [Sarracenia purpurea var. burkii]
SKRSIDVDDEHQHSSNPKPAKSETLARYSFTSFKWIETDVIPYAAFAPTYM